MNFLNLFTCKGTYMIDWVGRQLTQPLRVSRWLNQLLSQWKVEADLSQGARGRASSKIRIFLSKALSLLVGWRYFCVYLPVCEWNLLEWMCMCLYVCYVCASVCGWVSMPVLVKVLLLLTMSVCVVESYILIMYTNTNLHRQQSSNYRGWNLNNGRHVKIWKS